MCYTGERTQIIFTTIHKVTDGPSSIDMSSIATHLKFLYTNACEKYEQYKFNYISGINVGGKAILTPYSPGRNFNNY